MRVVPIQVVGDVGSGGAHAVVGLEVHPFVLHAAPQALDEDVVAPGTTPVHGQLAALGQNRFGELDCGELAALVGVDDLGHAVAREGLLDHLLSVDGFQREPPCAQARGGRPRPRRR